MYFGTSCSSIVRPFTLCQSLTYLNPCENVIFTILPLQNLPLSWRNLIGSLCNHVTWRMVEVVFLPACIGPCEQMTCSRKYLNECGNLNIENLLFWPKRNIQMCLPNHRCDRHVESQKVHVLRQTKSKANLKTVNTPI